MTRSRREESPRSYRAEEPCAAEGRASRRDQASGRAGFGEPLAAASAGPEQAKPTAIKGERANPQEIVGRQALFVVNLPPRKMAGEVSEGMLLDLGFADGITPALAVPERPVPNGTRAG